MQGYGCRAITNVPDGAPPESGAGRLTSRTRRSPITLHASTPPLIIRTMRRDDLMRTLAIGWILVALGIHGSGCARAHGPARVPAIQNVAATPAEVPNLFDVQRQVEHYIDSGQYDADVTRVAGEAQAYLTERPLPEVR